MSKVVLGALTAMVLAANAVASNPGDITIASLPQMAAFEKLEVYSVTMGSSWSGFPDWKIVTFGRFPHGEHYEIDETLGLYVSHWYAGVVGAGGPGQGDPHECSPPNPITTFFNASQLAQFELLAESVQSNYFFGACGPDDGGLDVPGVHTYPISSTGTLRIADVFSGSIGETVLYFYRRGSQGLTTVHQYIVLIWSHPKSVAEYSFPNLNSFTIKHLIQGDTAVSKLWVDDGVGPFHEMFFNRIAVHWGL